MCLPCLIAENTHSDGTFVFYGDNIILTNFNTSVGKHFLAKMTESSTHPLSSKFYEVFFFIN